MTVTLCVIFAKEPVRRLALPKEEIQGFWFEDPGGNAGLSIEDLPVEDPKGVHRKQLFIGQGRVKVYPTEDTLQMVSEKLKKDVFSSKISVLAKHFFGGAAQPIVEVFDCKSPPTLVDTKAGAEEQWEREDIIVEAPEICHIEIEGTEVAIERICFFFV